MATAAQERDNHAVKIDRIISRSLATIRANPLVVCGITLVFAGIPQSIFNVVMPHFMGGGVRIADPGQLVGYFSAIGLSSVGTLLFYMLAQASLVRATIAQSEGRRATFGECVGAGLRALLPLIGLNILFGLAIGVASLLLLVPGIILYVMWSVSNAALVAERIGIFAAFSRSSELTRGARWKVFGVSLIAVVFIWVVSSVLSLALVAVSGVGGYVAMARVGQPIWYLLLAAVVHTITVALWATIQASLYIELRDWKDGPSGTDLADVFA